MEHPYYTLKQIETYKLTDLRHRMIKYRFKDLFESGKIQEGYYVQKIGRKWYIHISIIDLFQARRRRQAHVKIHYVNEITINLHDGHNADYYREVGDYVNKWLSKYETIYRVEEGKKKNTFHIHIGTTAPLTDISTALLYLEYWLDRKLDYNKNLHVSKIRNLTLFLFYINKAVIC